jgi:hypothetical protein
MDSTVDPSVLWYNRLLLLPYATVCYMYVCTYPSTPLFLIHSCHATYLLHSVLHLVRQTAGIHCTYCTVLHCTSPQSYQTASTHNQQRHRALTRRFTEPLSATEMSAIAHAPVSACDAASQQGDASSDGISERSSTSIARLCG